MNVEWEPMTELERRVEDGVHYEHLTNEAHKKSQQQQQQTRRRNIHRDGTDLDDDDDIPSKRGVFIGYRYTEEEYHRLKSADP